MLFAAFNIDLDKRKQSTIKMYCSIQICIVLFVKIKENISACNANETMF